MGPRPPIHNSRMTLLVRYDAARKAVCSVNTSAVTKKTARILALRSRHRLAELPPWLPVGSCLAHDLERCPSLRSGRLIDSMLPLRERGRNIPSLYIWAAAGGIGALRRGFNSPAVIQMVEVFTKAITGSNYFWLG